MCTCTCIYFPFVLKKKLDLKNNKYQKFLFHSFEVYNNSYLVFLVHLFAICVHMNILHCVDMKWLIYTLLIIIVFKMYHYVSLPNKPHWNSVCVPFQTMFVPQYFFEILYYWVTYSGGICINRYTIFPRCMI